MIEINGDSGDLKNGLESLAYALAHYEHPTWYSVPEDEVVRLINEAVGYEVAVVYSS